MEGRQDIEQRPQDPGRAMERVLDPAAVPGLRRVEVGDPAAAPGVLQKDRAQEFWGEGDLFHVRVKRHVLKLTLCKLMSLAKDCLRCFLPSNSFV